MTMYASVLTLNANDLKRLRVKDAYSLHRVVYSLYSRQDKARILYSDQGYHNGQRRIFLLAGSPPNGQTPEGCGQVQTTSLSPALFRHEHYRFKVTINPVRRRQASGQREPIKDRQEIADWFADKTSTWGFEVKRESLSVENVEVMQFDTKDGQPVVIAKATLMGILSVTDTETFTNSFQTGLGRAKAFGCGLLQITPFDYQTFM